MSADFVYPRNQLPLHLQRAGCSRPARVLVTPGTAPSFSSRSVMRLIRLRTSTRERASLETMPAAQLRRSSSLLNELQAGSPAMLLYSIFQWCVISQATGATPAFARPQENVRFSRRCQPLSCGGRLCSRSCQAGCLAMLLFTGASSVRRVHRSAKRADLRRSAKRADLQSHL